MTTDNRAICTEKCWTAVGCPDHGDRMAPFGRSVSAYEYECCENRMNSAINPRHLWSEHDSTRWYTEPECLSIPIPNVPFGPEGVAPTIATANYLIDVVKKLDSGYANVGGSNVTATLRKLLVDAAEALRELPVGGESKP